MFIGINKMRWNSTQSDLDVILCRYRSYPAGILLA